MGAKFCRVDGAMSRMKAWGALLMLVTINSAASEKGAATTLSPQTFCSDQKSAKCEVTDEENAQGKLNGVWFQFLRGSAVVQGSSGTDVKDWLKSEYWSVNCDRDKITEVKSCVLRKNENEMFIRINSLGRTSLYVGFDHFPESQTIIKIGKKVFSTNDQYGYFQNPKQLLATMKDGAHVITRYTKWPDRSWVDSEFTTNGIDTAVLIARWMLKNGDIR